MSKARVKAALVLPAIMAAFTAVASAGDADRGVAHPKLWPSTHSPELADPQTEAFITTLMAKMSLEEKVGQMIQADISQVKPEDLRLYPLGSVLAGPDDQASAQGWVDTAQAFRAASLKISSRHAAIPILFGVDAVHGNGNVPGAVLFPHNIGLGAARDPNLIRKIGEATAAEIAAAGIDWTFAPTLPVPQDDRWGGVYQGYSENPALVREYAAEIVRGLQGDVAAGGLLQKGHVAATAKHFLGDGAVGVVDQGDIGAGEDDLIRIHAQGYPAAVRVGVLTVMASLPTWQGVNTHGNQSLLTGVLKERMGFQGFVIGAWNGHAEVPGCTASSCPAAIKAGLDMFMAPKDYKALFDATVSQARSGEIPQSRIDDAVRRILRVKVKLGLFDPARPYAGRLSLLGAPEHRSLAREAVRKSLVLLKNNSHLLPLRPQARILVAGDAADDIGRQSGGWSLSWQGTGHKNSDFPGGQSILAGLREAVAAAGGSIDYSPDGRFSRKPDVAIVVFGERPYAEHRGDISTLEYSPADKRDLALLRRLKAIGVPVVAVFLSGRPLWVNPELNASDAFVAAWLPGTEGGGVADLLIADAKGAPRYDFQGKLSFSWPKSADQYVLNIGQHPYDPQFAYGYGLTYRDRVNLQAASEDAAKPQAPGILDLFAAGRLAEGAQWRAAPEGVVALSTGDSRGIETAGERIVFSGVSPGTVSLNTQAIDLKSEINSGAALQIDYVLETPPTASVQIGVLPSSVRLEIGDILKAGFIGSPARLKIKLSCLAPLEPDAETQVSAPFMLTTSGGLALTVQTIKLSRDAVGAVCPPAAP